MPAAAAILAAAAVLAPQTRAETVLAAQRA